LNFWERCEISAILTTNVMGNGIQCKDIGKSFEYNWDLTEVLSEDTGKSRVKYRQLPKIRNSSQ
jgi:hypothetical protein